MTELQIFEADVAMHRLERARANKHRAEELDRLIEKNSHPGVLACICGFVVASALSIIDGFKEWDRGIRNRNKCKVYTYGEEEIFDVASGFTVHEE